MIFLVKILQNIHLQNNVKSKKSASGRWNKKDIFEYDQQKWRTCVVSLLQYMKNTTLNNPDIVVKDERITELDQIVTEVKQSEEWEAVK